MHDRILILDFGSQVTQLIARRVREAHVYCEIHPCDVDEAFVREFAPRGVILSGSHMSAHDESTDRAPDVVFALGVPVLGICYGMQTMAQQLGGRVEAGAKREFGYAEVRARGHTRLLDGLEDARNAEGHGMLKVWMSHGDKVVEMPAGFRLMASTGSCPIAGMADEVRGFYAVQFHPEVTHTPQGAKILQRFVLDICGCRPDWVMGDHIGEAVARIREQVGREPPHHQHEEEAADAEDGAEGPAARGGGHPASARPDEGERRAEASARCCFGERAHASMTSERLKVSGRPKAARPPAVPSAALTKRSSTRSRAAWAGSSASRKPRSPSTSVFFSARTSSSV